MAQALKRKVYKGKIKGGRARGNVVGYGTKEDGASVQIEIAAESGEDISKLEPNCEK